MKRIEREAKGEEADATDDEENVLPPTYTDEPHHEFEDRIGSKFASRSRAYVEADRALEDDAIRKRFNLARLAFVEKDEDADDSIEEVSGGYARFVGPDRAEAIAHYNLTTMMDAAIELDRTPTPTPKAPEIPVIPNAQAFDLMVLAELSAQQPRDTMIQRMEPSHQQPQSQTQHPEPQPHRASTPPIKQELTRQISPLNAPISIPLPSQAAHSSPIKASQPIVEPAREIPYSEPIGATETSKNVAPARISRHRIMDMLNDDQDVPVSKSKEAQPLPQEPSTPSRREPAPSQHNTPSHAAAPLVEADADKPVDQALMDALGGRPSEPPSPPPNNSQPWQRPTAPTATTAPTAPQMPPPQVTNESQGSHDPLQKIRNLLDRMARQAGREPPVRAPLPRVSSMQRAQEGRQERPQERPDMTGYPARYDPTHPSAGFHAASSSTGPSYPPAARRASQDWERDRRMSGSHAPQHPNQSPYSNPSQPYHGERHRTGPTPPNHHSPYAPPTGSIPLPPKPLVAPPVNFRFAHYDPAPPRPTYPPQSPTYLPGSHPPQLGPPPPQYAPGYPSPYQNTYVPPPGSFQAPPPLSNLTPYPPLKIHQYGGQPILPANMAPPPGPFQPHQQQQQPAYPPPHTQAPQSQPPRPEYQPPQRENHSERPPDPQSRPRRQYRSYHAPGTQFRTYQPSGRPKGG